MSKTLAKKTISVLLVTAMLLSVFAGCSSPAPAEPAPSESVSGEAPVSEAAPESEPEEVINITVSLSSTSDEVKTAAREKMFEDYNNLGRGIHVEPDYTPWSGFYDKLVTTAAAGTAGDVISFTSQWLPAFEGLDILVPLDDAYNNWEYKDEIPANIPELYKASSTDGNLYMIPRFLLSLYFVYRIDLFEEAGIEKVPETMDEFLEVCQKLTKDTNGDGRIDQYAYAMRVGLGADSFYEFALADMEEPRIWNDDGTLTFTDPDVLSGVQFFVDLYQKYGVVPETAPVDGSAECVNYLTSGTCAMYLTHFETVNSIIAGIGEENYGTFLPPAGKNGSRFVTLGETGTAVFDNGDPKKVEAAKDFALWWSEPDQHEQWVSMCYTPPYMDSVSEKYMDNPGVAISLEGLEKVDGFSYCAFPPVTNYSGEWANNVFPTYTAMVLENEISVEEYMTTLADKLING